MVHIILSILLVLFVIWNLRPLFKSKGHGKTEEIEDNTLNSNKKNLVRLNNIFAIMALTILFGLIVFILPKFGKNFLALTQRISSLISYLRSILRF